MAPISIADMTVRPTATIAAKAAQQGAHNGVTTETRGGGWKPVHMSSVVKSIRNPIREAIAGIDLSAPPSGEKPLINISLGDPTVFGNLPPPPAALTSIIASLESGRSHGYPQSAGYPIALQAVSDYFDEGYMGGNWRVRTEDVVMTHGASGALEMAFHVLADKSKNVLMPRPGFSSYETMVTTTQAEVRFYDLIADNNWEVDLVQLESLIDENTAFVLLNNPSNPCGSNWSLSHCLDIAALCGRLKVVVLSDEVYAGMAWNVTGPQPTPTPEVPGKFNRGLFIPYASICGDSPCLVLGATSKRWLAPGWRLGWVIVHDPLNVMTEVREGLGRWAGRIQGPSSTMQCALPQIFNTTPSTFFSSTLTSLSHTGQVLFDRLSSIQGLVPLLPQGAMYLMCGGLDKFGFKDDKEFVAALMKEEKVLILPGACFQLDNYMRFVTSVPLPMLMMACDRLEAFCTRHRPSKSL